MWFILSKISHLPSSLWLMLVWTSQWAKFGLCKMKTFRCFKFNSIGVEGSYENINVSTNPPMWSNCNLSVSVACIMWSDRSKTLLSRQWRIFIFLRRLLHHLLLLQLMVKIWTFRLNLKFIWTSSRFFWWSLNKNRPSWQELRWRQKSLRLNFFDSNNPCSSSSAAILKTI